MISLSGPALAEVDRDSDLYQLLHAANKRLAVSDPTLWGEAAATEAAIRLGWVDLPTTSRALLPELDAVSARMRNKKRIILCGMGGSSLGPEVIAATYQLPLFVCDSTDPDYLAHALTDDFSQTLIVVASKSGSTLETSSQRAFFERHLMDLGLDPRQHMLFITDPGSPLDKTARTSGFTVVNADPNVGGRFSVLSAFGLVPAALIGVDVSHLLDSAEHTRALLTTSPLAIDVAYLLATATDQYCGFTDHGSTMPGLSDWIEQLIAESTGKDGRGRLPVVTPTSKSAREVGFGISFSDGGDLNVVGDLGSHFIFWEWVTALLGVALKVDPFNQPNVTEAKEQTSALLAQWNGVLPAIAPDAVDGSLEFFGLSLREIVDAIPEGGYLAIMAYLDRIDQRELTQIRDAIATASGKVVTFGWGPRFLHSTGQFHKAGQPNGAFLQISGTPSHDFAVPEQNFTFDTLLQAQCQGDGLALARRGYPVTRIHLHHRTRGVQQLLAAARAL